MPVKTVASWSHVSIFCTGKYNSWVLQGLIGSREEHKLRGLFKAPSHEKSPVPATCRHRREVISTSLHPRAPCGPSAPCRTPCQLSWLVKTAHSSSVGPKVSTMPPPRGRSEALSSSLHRSRLFQDTASLDARIVVIEPVLTPCTVVIAPPLPTVPGHGISRRHV